MNHITQYHDNKESKTVDTTQISIFKYDKDLVDTVEYGYKMAYNYWRKAELTIGLFYQLAGRYKYDK